MIRILVWILFSFLVAEQAFAGGVIQGDSWVNNLKTKTWTPPSVTGTISCVACTESPTNKTFAIGSNTWTGQFSAANGGTGQNFSSSTGAISVSSGTFSAGTLSVTNGGTGAATLASNGVLYGNGTSAIGATAAGVNGKILIANTGAAPSWAYQVSLGDPGSLTGRFALSGSTSGTVFIQPQNAAGTYNLNLPTSAGNSGEFLTSAGGGSSVMTWTAPSSITSLGTIATGVWNGTAVSTTYGGLGIDSHSSTGFYYDTSGTASVKTATQATALLDAVVGDSGSGGTKGLVPAPASGDAPASKFLKADGTWTAVSASGSSSQSYELSNIGIKVTVAASAMTVALVQADGSTNCASGSGTCYIGFRNSTIGTGGYVQRQVTGALSVVVSNGSALGCIASSVCTISVYAVDSGSGVVLGVINGPSMDENALQSGVAEGGAGGADTINTLYTTATQTSKPVRRIAQFKITPAASFAWTNAVATTKTSFFGPVKPPTYQIFTASGACTYTLPHDPAPDYLEIEMVGGGGGGGEASGGNAGSAGGNTTWNSTTLVANGGAGGSGTSANVSSGGSVSVAAPATQIVALTGTGGEAAYVNSTGNYYQGGKGGCSPFGGCGPGRMADTGIAAIANTGSGGSGAGGTTAGQSGAGGASGGYVRAIIPAPVASVSCNVGALGAGGTGTAGSDGGNGAVGTIIVKEVYQ